MMPSKKILVLGAGVYQVPLIQRAKSMGHHTFACSYRQSDLGMPIADASFVVDTTDKEGVLKVCKENEIDAVVTTGTDVAVPTLGFVCDALKLNGVSLETAQLASNKILMKQRFKERGVPTAKFEEVSTEQECLDVAKRIGFPCIIKAPDSSGSRGVIAVHNLQSVPSGFSEAMDHSRVGSVIVEKMLVGEEFGAQLIVQHGKVLRTLFHNDQVTPPPISVPVGHSCPCTVSTKVQQEATAVCQMAVEALGIENAICNVDLMVTDDGVYIFEIGARAGATGIPEMIQASYQIDLYQVGLDLALGNSINTDGWRSKEDTIPSAVHLLTSERAGEIEGYSIPLAVKNDDDVKLIRLDKVKGQNARKFQTGPDRIGDILIIAETVERAEIKVQSYAQSIEVELVSVT